MQIAVIGTGYVGLVSVLDPERARAAGFLYVGTGRGVASQWVTA